MDAVRRYTLTNAVLFVVALAHGLLTWPLVDVAALFVGGAAIAFVLEVVGVAWGLFDHEMGPQVLDVPLAVVVAWPAVVYLTYRAALVVLSPGAPAAVAAGVLATALDVTTELDAVEEGVWTYPEHPISGVRWRGIPLWNFVAWFTIVFVTAMLPTWV
jgi:hypothetical protein